MRRNLVRSFVVNGFIKTTKPKAVFLRSKVERLVKWAKNGNLSSRRKLLAEIPSAGIVAKFISDAKVFKDRKGGYTTLVNLGKRVGDKADMVKMKWSDSVKDKKVEKQTKEK